MPTHEMLLQFLEKLASTTFFQIQRPTDRHTVLMLHVIRFSDVRLLIGYPKVFSMETY